ncbi:fructosamine kinase family protein [Egicoccus sp. AB-alg2]|uniref:fructosamine kinase family protein n=1 Tax=Egicoccus sp. AB-alg2 TaxID=3242693 RepID=UPI00359D124E
MNAPPQLPDDLPAIRHATPLGGGDTARAWRAQLADGHHVVVKATPYDAGLEAEGLRVLAEAGGPVPAVLGVAQHVLVMEHVAGPADWERLGAALAHVHGHHGEGFGWYRDNVIGPLPQRNGWRDSSGAFVVERRIRPYLDDLPHEVARRLAAACDGPLPDLLDAHAPAPSLVHGDLWTGNVVDGRWLVDPAVHHADRETDLAMLTLFGAPPPAFWSGYEAVAPLPDGWRRRRPALQLPPLLVHVRLFGHGFVPSVVRALDAAGLP